MVKIEVANTMRTCYISLKSYFASFLFQNLDCSLLGSTFRTLWTKTNVAVDTVSVDLTQQISHTHATCSGYEMRVRTGP